ncbi:hypothetical protein KC323_g191 [Hortaea werneckii]|nr:hypothetical protein KC323_g191 [Hortaea werneckii]
MAERDWRTGAVLLSTAINCMPTTGCNIHVRWLPHFRLSRMQILVFDPSRMRAILTTDDLIRARRVAPAVGTEPGKVEGARDFMLDVSHGAVWAQRTEAAGVVRTSSLPQPAGGANVKVCAIIALRTDSIAAEFFALALVAQVECMRELTRVALLAQATLVVLADQVTDAGSLVGGDIMAVGTERTARAVAALEVGADGTVNFGRSAQAGDLAVQEGVEGEGRWDGGLRVEDLMRQGRLGVGCGHGGRRKARGGVKLEILIQYLPSADGTKQPSRLRERQKGSSVRLRTLKLARAKRSGGTSTISPGRLDFHASTSSDSGSRVAANPHRHHRSTALHTSYSRDLDHLHIPSPNPHPLSLPFHPTAIPETPACGLASTTGTVTVAAYDEAERCQRHEHNNLRDVRSLVQPSSAPSRQLHGSSGLALPPPAPALPALPPPRLPIHRGSDLNDPNSPALGLPPPLPSPLQSPRRACRLLTHHRELRRLRLRYGGLACERRCLEHHLFR